MADKQEITSREDIKLMVNLFYEKVRKDEVIGYIFNDIARVDWEAHLPVMYDFWETMLLNKQKYKGNAMQPHIRLDQEKVQLKPEHFQRWLKLFTETVDNNFKGDKAEEAKNRAQNIASMMEFKVKSLR